jgi:DHA3 family macrolide efflux protein-like MFS transporter
LGVGSFIIGITPRDAYWMAVTGMAIVGMMNTFANGPFFAILQSVVPPMMQGRVFTVLMSISMSAVPIGLAVAGPLADRWGVQIWYVLGALICAVIVVWILLSPALMTLEEKQIDLAAAANPVAE